MYMPQENPKLPTNNSPSSGLNARTTVTEALYHICLFQLEQFDNMLPVALAGEDIEGVHKVRVALRRLRTCLKFGKPFYPTNSLETLLKDLKEITRTFGGVRDLDVFKNNFASQQIQILNLAKNNKITILRENILRAIWPDTTKETAHPNGVPTSVDRYLPAVLIKKMNTLMKIEISRSQPSFYTDLHKLRLKAKTLRYLIEFFSPILEMDSADALVESMVVFQDHLGLLNDTVIAQNIIESQSGKFHSDQGKQATAEYLQHLLVERNQLVTGFEEIWQGFLKNDPLLRLESALVPLTGN